MIRSGLAALLGSTPFARALLGSPDEIAPAQLAAPSPASRSALDAALDLARTASTTADTAHLDAQRAVDGARGAVDEAAAAYDDGPAEDDAAAALVLSTRNAHELAVIRRDRAAGRATAARASFVAAEHAVARSEALDAVTARTDEARLARTATSTASHELAELHRAPTLTHAIDYTSTRAAALGSRLTAARAKHEAALAALDLAELAAVELAPDLAPDLAASREQRDADRREELGAAASVETFRATIADDVALVVLAERLAAEAKDRIAAARDAQIIAAGRARAAGLQAFDLDAKHLETHLLVARASTPEERHDLGRKVRELCGGMGWAGYHPSTPRNASVTSTEIVEAYLAHARPSEAGRAVVKLQHLRSITAGDVNAIKYERERGDVERDPELAAALAIGAPLCDAESSAANQRFAEQQQRAAIPRYPHEMPRDGRPS